MIYCKPLCSKFNITTLGKFFSSNLELNVNFVSYFQHRNQDYEDEKNKKDKDILGTGNTLRVLETKERKLTTSGSMGTNPED